MENNFRINWGHVYWGFVSVKFADDAALVVFYTVPTGRGNGNVKNENGYGLQLKLTGDDSKFQILVQ